MRLSRLVTVSLGQRKAQQTDLFLPTGALATGPGHPFYTKLNEILAQAGFDEFVKKLCAPLLYRGRSARHSAGR